MITNKNIDEMTHTCRLTIRHQSNTLQLREFSIKERADGQGVSKWLYPSISQNSCIPPSTKMATSFHPSRQHPPPPPPTPHFFFFFLLLLLLLKLSFSFLPDAACTDTQHQKADKGVATPATQTFQTLQLHARLSPVSSRMVNTATRQGRSRAVYTTIRRVI